ncbi:YggS family pyridoxal phosphate-dependent enzyme [Undibacterium amnicola]|uniref:Pyridoxal phosphate homeostasis protein n=1 Tax=Undibacterium amnicola TaxID=1834038 RepID=A0ABR6XTE6_9BURK|nr:YggS family pyridoxal phosphate-dependent enzyme [Undibacterium amnicola]MBC3832781.1 YggS family pyridoxal phosphate-dependent enzyme [Undibacterium amnicola]
MSSIPQNLQAVHEAIALSAARYDRNPTEIALLAVSKTFGAEQVLQAWQAGQRAFGENYVQEGVDKIAEVRRLLADDGGAEQLVWHFIGPIQSNKTRQIAENFSWVHSIDREKIATRLSEQRPSSAGKLQVCLQVNISGEASKSGVTPDQVDSLAKHVVQLPNLCLRGLMCVPEASEDEAVQRQAFRQLAVLQRQLQTQGIAVDTLSMGMSADMQAAIAEGSTIVRIGSAIFGKRDYAV